MKAANKPVGDLNSKLKGLGDTFKRVAGISEQIAFIGTAFQQVTGLINAARAAGASFYESFINGNVQLPAQKFGLKVAQAKTSSHTSVPG